MSPAWHGMRDRSSAVMMVPQEATGRFSSPHSDSTEFILDGQAIKRIVTCREMSKLLAIIKPATEAEGNTFASALN